MQLQSRRTMARSTRPCIGNAAFALFTVWAACIHMGDSARSAGAANVHLRSSMGATAATATAAGDVNLTRAKDMLGGLHDAVTASMGTVRTALTGVDTTCMTTFGLFQTRVTQHEVVKTQLDATRVQSLQEQAKLQANLDKLSRAETSARASYESSVTQRASEKKSHIAGHAERTTQQDVLGDVLSGLRTKRAVILSPGGNTTTTQAPGVPTRAPPGSSQLDFIIGVFDNMQDDVTTKIGEESDSHSKKDAQFNTLVERFKATLQHTDAQYELKAAQEAAQESRALHASQEKAMRQSWVDSSTRVITSLGRLCGTGGSLPLDEAEVARQEEALRAEVAETLATMTQLPAITTATTTAAPAAGNLGGALLAKTQKVQLATAASPTPASAVQDDVMRLAAEATARRASAAKAGSAGSAPEAPKRAESAFESALKAEQDMDKSIQTFAGLLLPTSGLGPDVEKVLVDFSHRVGGSVVSESAAAAASSVSSRLTTATASPLEVQTAAIESCAQEKQNLTMKIVIARQSARTAREAVNLARERSAAIGGWLPLAAGEKQAMSDAQGNMSAAWSPVETALNGTGLGLITVDALAELARVETEVNTYINTPGSAPLAQRLPHGIALIRKILEEARDSASQISGDATTEKGNLQLLLSREINSLSTEETNLAQAQSDANATLASAAADVTTHETSETDNMNLRTAAEARCNVSTATAASGPTAAAATS